MDVASILVVDDDEDTCCNLVDLLGERGYRVDVAHNGTSALGLAQETDYRLALLDFQLPGMNGLDLFRRLRETCRKTEGILITGFATPNVMTEGLQCGLCRVMLKPLKIHELLSLVDEVIGRPSSS